MLDELPERATERLEWRQRLGDEWPVVRPLLRRTGRVAHAIACPFPSGDGCPRRVVRHADGRIGAVCGERPQRCEPIVLDEDDIDVLELNGASFVHQLRGILGLGEARDSFPNTAFLPVGTLGVRAGFGLPVLLAFPNAEQPVVTNQLPDAAGGIILTPTGRFVDGVLSKWTSLSLAEVISIDARDAIIATAEWTTAADAIKARAADTMDATSKVVWRLPPDGRWEEISFEFVGSELLQVRFRGDTRAFEPLQLRMRHKRNVKPTLHWTLLQAFAECGGEISWSTGRANYKVKKQKQLLSAHLIECFGITTDPIIWDRREGVYRTRFRIGGWRTQWRNSHAASHAG
jgi:hypothetical protein